VLFADYFVDSTSPYIKTHLLLFLWRSQFKAATVTLHQICCMVLASVYAWCFLKRDCNYFSCHLGHRCQKRPVAPLITLHVELFAFYILLIYTV